MVDRRFYKYLISLLLVLVVVVHAADKADNGAINAVMRHNFDSLMKLLPLVASEDEFRKSGNEDDIEESLKSLADVGRGLPALVGNSKPGIKAIATIFADYTANAEKNFKAGYKDYVRNQIRTVTGFCMACHTRSDMKAEFKAGESKVMAANLTSLQRAEYFAATRQFDKALEYYDQVISQPATSEMALRDVVRVIRSYLSIAVRVKQDPKAAYGFATKVSQVQGASQFYARDIDKWKESLSAWMKEKKVSTDQLSAVQLLARGKALVTKAQKMQMYPADHSADIEYLRSTNELHAALEKGLSSAGQRAEAFYLLGVSYGALNEPLLWDLDGLYYEACIKESPHNAQAQQCYKRLASTIYIGFSGSAGVNVPEEQLNRLSTLRKLAF